MSFLSLVRLHVKKLVRLPPRRALGICFCMNVKPGPDCLRPGLGRRTLFAKGRSVVIVVYLCIFSSQAS
eukprot:scaffold3319_cov258-Pinguiococcus_pyrenoidosus.AAC.4